MKHIYSVILTITMFSIGILQQNVASAQYCLPTYTNSCIAPGSNGNDYIQSFSTSGGITNISNLNSACCNTSATNGNNYFYYSTQTHSATLGSTVNFSYVNNPLWSEGYKIWVDWNQNGSFTDVGELVYNPSATNTASSTGAGSFVIPSNALTGVTRLRIRCVFASTNFDPCNNQSHGETEDYNLEVLPLTCSGTPNASVSGPNTFCSNPIVLNAVANPSANNFTYQWESSPACANNFSPIPGAINSTYTITSQAANTDYRVIITCPTSGVSGTSAAFQVLAPVCYCASAASSGTGSDIGRLSVTQVSGSFANPAAAATPLTVNGTATGTYNDFTGGTPVIFTPPFGHPFTVTQINSAGYIQSYLKIFIDFNKNGVFDLPGEQVYSNLGSGGASAATFTGSIIVPAGTPAGYTRMRLVLVEGGNASTVSSCGNYANGETEDYRVYIQPVIQAPVATNSGPICAGAPLNLFAVSNAAGCPTFSWTGPNGFSSNLQNPTIPVTTAASGGVYSVTVTSFNVTSPAGTTNVSVLPSINTTSNVNVCSGDTIFFGSYVITGSGTYTNNYTSYQGCDSNVTLNVTLVPKPQISSVTGTNPTTCLGTNGTISVNGLTPNTSYTLNYSKNSVAQLASAVVSNASGVIVISGLTAGSYSDISVTFNGCASPTAGPVVLSDPNGPTPPSVSNNGPICAGSTLNLNASTVAGASYSWSGPGGYFSASQNPSISNAQTANGGSYSVTITVNNCTSAPASTTATVNPVPVIASTGTVNPTTCGGTDGSISLSGLSGGATYTVNYTQNSIAQAPQTLTASGLGVITIPNLTAGTYTAITVTINGCTSPAAGPLVISNPAAPAAPGASSNSPVCQGSTINLFATTLSGGTYAWTGPNGFSSSQQNPTISNAQNVNAGSYSVTVSLNNCVSAAGTTSVVVNPVPVIGGTSSVNPTTCGGTNGSITLSGLSSNVAYSVSYTYNSTAIAPTTIVSGATGNVVITGLAAGSYTNITVTLNNCTSLPAGPITLTSPNPPAAPAASSNSPVCSGGTLNLNTPAVAGATYSWTGPNSFASASQNPSINLAQPVASGTYSVTVTTNNCTSVAGTTLVVVNPTPAITGSSFIDPNACATNTGSITLTGLTPNTSYSVNYTKNGVIQPAVTLSSNGSGNLVVPNLGAGTYTNISVTLNGCNSNTVLQIVLSDPSAPAAPVAGNSGPVCQGGTLNLTATTVAGASYTWTGPNGFNSSSQNPTISNIQTAAAGTYSVTATVSNCVSAAATTNVVIYATPPTPAPSSNSPLCDGSDIHLTTPATGSATYSWTGPNGFNSNQQNPDILGATPSNSGTYTVSVTVNGCSSSSASTNVIVHPIPAAPGTSNISHCQFSVPPALTAVGQNLLWYTVSIGGLGTATAPVPSTAIAGQNTWYVSQTVNGCESPRSSITVTIVPKPQAPLVLSPVTYCQYMPAAPLAANGLNLLWYTNASGGTGASTAPVPQTTVPGTTIYYVSQTVNGCESDRAAITVIIYAKPDTPVVSNPIQFCQYDSNAVITAQGQNLKWYSASTGGVGSPVTPAVNTSIPGTTVHYVTQTQNGCESDRAMAVVIVHEKVYANVNLSKNVICQYDTIQVVNYASNPASAVYTWSFDSATVMNGTGAGPYDIKWLTAGTKSVTVDIVNGTCSATDTKLVTVKPSPLGEFSIKEEACIGEQVMLQAAWNSLNGENYAWDFDGATINSGSGAGYYKLRWNTPGPKNILMVMTLNGCRSQPHYDTILIHENPPAAIQAPDITADICTGDDIEFNAAATSSTYSYLWTPENFFSVNGQDRVTGKILGAGFVFLKVTDDAGCSSKDSMFLDAKPCCDVFLPDAFTPNGDGRNDIFRIVTQGNHQVSVFRIVNRWGQTVFETANEKEGWDGFFQQRPQPSGVYYYYLRFRCDLDQIMEKKGEVTLVR